MAVSYAREQGYNNYIFYNPKLKEQFTDTIRLQNDLYKALKSGELALVFQPKVRFQDKTISGFEALLRWNNPEYGSISPSKFIPLAESNDLINELGKWVLDEAIRNLAVWSSHDLDIKPVAVNLSVKQLDNINFFRYAEEQLFTAGIKINMLEFEITESLFIENLDQTNKIMQYIQSIGFRIALDDFGTGYSSLAYIKNFPFNKVKIDKAFIKDIPADKNATSIVAGIISMAQNLGFIVIAEGVENENQAAFLRKNNCDEMQGFLFSKPLPPDEVAKLLF